MSTRTWCEANADRPAEHSTDYFRVLVIDDNRDTADTTAMLLRMWGYQAEAAYDELGAIRAAETHPPQVVLLDLGLTGTDGYELARLLRERPGLANVPIVAVTGYGGENERKRTQAAGFRDHLVKPVAPLDLRQLLNSLR
jgi:CheY-like chemotaxis protein